MPLLLDDFTHARTCKPFCEKYLTLPSDLLISKHIRCGHTPEKWRSGLSASDLLISKHIRCGHTPEKWRSGLSAGTPFFSIGIVPNPLLSEKNSPRT